MVSCWQGEPATMSSSAPCGVCSRSCCNCGDPGLQRCQTSRANRVCPTPPPCAVLSHNLCVARPMAPLISTAKEAAR
eukprot:7860027-Prorocentrum_lima.AAC.1